MNAPQIIILVIVFVGLLIASRQHGKPKEGTHNFWVDLLSNAILILLLWWGGFFPF